MERGIETLLDKHQLKGLHLIRSQKRKEFDEHYKEYGLRRRLKYFLKKNRESYYNGDEKHRNGRERIVPEVINNESSELKMSKSPGRRGRNKVYW